MSTTNQPARRLTPEESLRKRAKSPALGLWVTLDVALSACDEARREAKQQTVERIVERLRYEGNKWKKSTASYHAYLYTADLIEKEARDEPA